MGYHLHLFSCLALLALLLPACGSIPPRPASTRTFEPRDFTIELQVEKTGRRIIHLIAQTNLPEGSNLLISVTRDYDETITDQYLPKKDQTASGDIYSKDHPVVNGKVEVDVNVDDKAWTDERKRRVARFKPAGMIFSPLRNVHKEVEVRALFSPARNQPQTVLEITGRRGELIRNPAPGVVRVIEAVKSVEIPFQP